MTEYHVIPVPHHMSPLDAFDELDTIGHFIEYRWWKPRFWKMRWAVIEVED